MPFQHQIAEGEEISQALRHLLAFHQQKAGVKPEVREGLSGERLGLGDFVFVMRENQIFTAGVQVETLAQFLHRHDRALEMPAGAARPNHRVPGGFVGFRRFPQGEVAGAVLVVFIDIYASAIEHAAKIFL